MREPFDDDPELWWRRFRFGYPPFDYLLPAQCFYEHDPVRGTFTRYAAILRRPDANSPANSPSPLDDLTPSQLRHAAFIKWLISTGRVSELV